MAGFFKNLVNRVNDRAKEFFGGAGAEPDIPPDPPWGQAPDLGGPPPRPEPIFEEPAPNTLDNVSLYDDFGSYIGTETWSGWWDATIDLRYNGRIHVINLITVISEEYDIEWDWQAWREAYAAAHAGV